MFGGRWLVQFVASKRAGKPVIPRLFWYMSVGGSLMTLSYFMFLPNRIRLAYYRIYFRPLLRCIVFGSILRIVAGTVIKLHINGKASFQDSLC